MNGTQCRMARAALGWSLKELADAVGVSTRTIMRHEKCDPVAAENVEAMRAVFVRHGIEFINGGKRAGVAYQRKD